MKLHERVLHLLARPDYVPMARGELAARLGLAGGEARRLDAELRRLTGTGEIVRIKGDRYCRPADAELVTGRIQFRPAGSAQVIPEAGVPGGPVQVAAEDTGTAMHGDRVVVRLEGSARPDCTRAGRVVRVLQRDRETLTGTVQRTPKFHYVVPDDPRFVHDIYVPDPAETALAPRPAVGDKVIVRLADWPNRHVNPEGEIISVLGRTFEPRAEMAALYHKYRLPTAFPPAVEREAAALPDAVRPSDLAGRRDLRSLDALTIDPDDAKDFDDALSLERLGRGRLRVGIHIADVGAYVRPGTALDREAQERGNSTYLVGTVVPMLPFKLSNGLCSLREGEDRLVKTVLVTFARDGAVEHAEFANAVIRSRKRLTYRQAYALLREDDLEAVRRLPLPPAHQTGATGRPLSNLSDEELRKLQETVRALWDIAYRLRARRMREGSLDLDMPETKIFVDAEGYADRIETIENDESHQLVEEFMLLANESVARLTRERRLPSLYRVHDDPDEDKLADFRQFAATLGLRSGDLTDRRELSRLLARCKDHDQGRLLRVQLLRSLKRACYRASPDGHFGLNKRDYTHFTSPIRRYADLVVHRVVEQHLDGAPGPHAGRRSPPLRADRAAALAEHLTLTEGNSTEAERESVKVKLLEFFERETRKRKPQSFEAVVLEIRNHGMFVELVESQAWGLVHVSTLKDDMYYATDGGTALVGRRRKRRFTLGQKLPVVVHRVDRFKRQIDFRVADDR